MKKYLFATISLILGASTTYSAQKEKEPPFSEPSMALHQEIEQKSEVLKGLQGSKPSQVPQFVTAQYKEYLDALKKIEEDAKANRATNIEESKSTVAQTYNIFTEIYYQ